MGEHWRVPGDNDALEGSLFVTFHSSLFMMISYVASLHIFYIWPLYLRQVAGELDGQILSNGAGAVS